MLIFETNPRLYLTEHGTVLFLYLGTGEVGGSLCEVWQSAVQLPSGETTHGSVALLPGLLPTLACACSLVKNLVGPEGPHH